MANLNFAKVGRYLPHLFLIAIVYFVYRQFKGSGLVSQLFGQSQDEKNTRVAEDIIKNIPVAVGLASFSVAQAKIYAEQLQKAMNPISGLSPDYDGTNEDAIFSIFERIKNKEDAKLIYREFGMRAYTKNWFLDNQNLDLVSWLGKELSEADLKKIAGKIKMMVYE